MKSVRSKNVKRRSAAVIAMGIILLLVYSAFTGKMTTPVHKQKAIDSSSFGAKRPGDAQPSYTLAYPATLGKVAE